MTITSVLIPCSLDVIRRIKSKKIIADFVLMGVPRAEVDVKATGRDFQQVYSALLMYLKRHTELEVELVREDGAIVLYNNSVRTGGSVYSEEVGR